MKTDMIKAMSLTNLHNAFPFCFICRRKTSLWKNTAFKSSPEKYGISVYSYLTSFDSQFTYSKRFFTISFPSFVSSRASRVYRFGENSSHVLKFLLKSYSISTLFAPFFRDTLFFITSKRSVISCFYRQHKFRASCIVL